MTNLYGSGYRCECGEGDFFYRSPSGKMFSLLRDPIDMRSAEIYTASDWGMQKTYFRSFGDNKLHLCTALRHGYQTPWGRAHGRQPGFNLFIEGDISQKEMNEIKKNLVEKGLIEKYEKEEDKESLIGIYQEIIKYLNK